MSYRIKHARKMMKKEFKKNEDFHYGYIANVAMILHDKLNVIDTEKRNEIANIILYRIFGL